MDSDNDSALWTHLLWGEATSALDEAAQCADKVCACQCVADLASVAYANEVRDVLTAA